MMPYLQFDPLYQERVWGGRALADQLGRTLPTAAPIGESWEIVDRPEAQSLVRGGDSGGRTLRQVIEQHASDVMGPGWPAKKPFPILVKWLDCRERLSLQVHPPASVAGKLGGEPKTENWYIAHAGRSAAVLAGLKAGVTPDDFERALANNTAEELVERHETRAGDSLLIHSGIMHAIDAGNLILEIQQNSDTTYRVYDWGRVGL
ncbi:MAG TPA: type I phosphomannose isomerase catalytic subunit, partial [Candidatus Didemnitutus sp.]|nr:type I phosphomannose isomerase catalytic subunit [Candidatus Didemnitutus sp.]